MRTSARAIIDRPIEDVWAVVADLERMQDWVDGVSDVRWDGELGVGTQFASKYAYRARPFDVAYEVTPCDPPHRLDISSTQGPFPFDGSIRLAEADGGTTVSNTIDAGSDSLVTTVTFALLGPLVRRMMRRQLATEFDQLADGIDGAAAAQPTEAGP